MKNDEIKFSVLMSVYYKENPLYLKQAIHSILNQSLKPTQIVLVCDGTLTDELYSVIDTYEHAYSELFDVVKYAENKGLGKALNVGLEHCKYEYVARMDSDDIARSDRFAIQLDYLKKHPEIGLLGSWIAEFDSDPSHIISYRKTPITYEEIMSFARKRNPFNHMSVVFKKDDVKRVGGYLDMPLAEDYYLWARMLGSGVKGGNIDDCLVYARTGTDMLKRRSGLSYAKKMYNLRKQLYKLKFINFYEFVLYSSLHSIAAICPLNIKDFIYGKLHK